MAVGSLMVPMHTALVRLEDLADRLTADGYEPQIVEENFGRSIRVTDPDGIVVQIQQIDLDTARRSEEQMRP